jgi:hypothetical protein
MKKNSTEVILKATGYRILDKDFIPPALKQVDFNVLQSDLDTYTSLKDR